MAHSHNSGSTVRIFLKFCIMKGVDRQMKIILIIFSKKNFVWDKWTILGPKMVHPLISGSTVRFFLKFCTWILLGRNWAVTIGSLNSQDMIRILKQLRHDFSGKHLCDGYCMDIMWCLCVEVIWFCKASLRICYVSLFECKSPWMLKTDSLIF